MHGVLQTEPSRSQETNSWLCVTKRHAESKHTVKRAQQQETGKAHTTRHTPGYTHCKTSTALSPYISYTVIFLQKEHSLIARKSHELINTSQCTHIVVYTVLTYTLLHVPVFCDTHSELLMHLRSHSFPLHTHVHTHVLYTLNSCCIRVCRTLEGP